MDVADYLKDQIDESGLNKTITSSNWEVHRKKKEPLDYAEWLIMAYDIDGENNGKVPEPH